MYKKMSKLGAYLILSVMLGLFLTADAIPHISTAEMSNRDTWGLKFMLILIILFVVFSLTLNLFQRRSTPRIFAKQISSTQFEEQKKSYTQKQLSALINTKGFRELALRKQNQPYMPYEEIKFSDEENE